LPSIVERFPHAVVLAAGGLATGAHLASMLALGAEGAVFGTKFLVSDESLYSAEQKKAVRDAKGSRATIRTTAFDEASELSPQTRVLIRNIHVLMNTTGER
jgi:nitronate monooxygenase